MSTLALIVILLLAVAILATAGRLRARPGPRSFDDDPTPYRSHAEASRRSDAEGF